MLKHQLEVLKKLRHMQTIYERVMHLDGHR